MKLLTRTQKMMLKDLARHGGKVRGLWAMTDRLGLNYSKAYRKVHELERIGAINIVREGRCLVISIRSE